MMQIGKNIYNFSQGIVILDIKNKFNKKNINLTLERNVFLIFRHINRVNCSEY